MSRPSAPQRGGNPVWIGLLLLFVTLAVYAPVKNCDYVHYDDDLYVTANPNVQSGVTWANVGWAFRTDHACNWHPLTWLSHMLDDTLFGPGASGPHLMNLALHIISSFLLFLLLRQITDAYWRSVIVALLFALHPLHVESVAWVAERKDVLSAAFGLLSLLSYARFTKNKKAVTYLLALTFFALGLMSKPMLVTLPFAMLLLDWWPLKRVSGFEFGVSSWKPLLVEKFPFFALSAASSVVTFLVQRESGVVNPLAVISLTARIENSFVAYARYLGKIFWPFDLAIFYPYPAAWPLWEIALAAVFVIGLSFGALWQSRRRPFLFTGWFWFVGMLIPVIGLVQVGAQSMADRYTYLPAIGAFIALVWGANELAARWLAPHLRQLALGATAFLVVAACAARTHDQLRHWQDGESLARHALAVTANNHVVANILGTALVNKGDADGAIESYRQAVTFNPNFPEAWNNLGNALAGKGQLPDAIAAYREAIRINPRYAEATYNLGNALLGSGQLEAALASYQQTLQLDPSFVLARNNIGSVLLQQGKVEEAKASFSEAIRINPNCAEALGNLGYLLTHQNKFAEAIPYYTTAARLQPSNAQMQFNLGWALAQTGRRDEAIAHLTAGLQLNPNNDGARQLLRTLGATGF
jgi:tetratricopeptide (TPR) repeat protein